MSKALLGFTIIPGSLSNLLHKKRAFTNEHPVGVDISVHPIVKGRHGVRPLQLLILNGLHKE